MATVSIPVWLWPYCVALWSLRQQALNSWLPVPDSRRRSPGVSRETQEITDKGLVTSLSQEGQQSKPLRPTMFCGRKYKPSKWQARRARYLGRLVADIENPNTESAKARRTRFMKAVGNPALLNDLRGKYVAARAAAEAWRS